MNHSAKNDRKIAFLEDFDGPIFDSELIVDAVVSFLNVPKEEWDVAYKEAKNEGTFVDIGIVFSILSNSRNINVEKVWDFLETELRDAKYCPEANKIALKSLLKLGHMELITQGNRRLQELKLKSSGVGDLISEANSENTINVIETDKAGYLNERLEKLIKDEFVVIQIDDRDEPIRSLKEHAQTLHIESDRFVQYHLNVGKYGDNKLPRYGLQEAVGEIINLIRPYSQKESHGGASRRR
jgi:hypothetical protein